MLFLGRNAKKVRKTDVNETFLTMACSVCTDCNFVIKQLNPILIHFRRKAQKRVTINVIIFMFCITIEGLAWTTRFFIKFSKKRNFLYLPLP